MGDNSGTDEGTCDLATLCETIAAAEAVLEGPPPEGAEPADCRSFRDWIDKAGRAESWPPTDPPMSNTFWQDTKHHVTEIIRVYRALDAPPAEGCAEGVRLLDVLHAFISFGAVYALNCLEPVGSDGQEREPRYHMSPEEKADALGAVLNGWTIADSKFDQPRGIPWFLLNLRSYAAKGFGSLKFLFTHIDYYLESRKLGDKARIPHMLRQVGPLPSIVAQEVGVRFLIRYHKSDVTVRDTLLGALRGASRARNNDGRSRREFWALRGINFTARPGDVVGVLGPNGSGKTTLLKTLAGIMDADQGRVSVQGKIACLLSFGVGFNANLSGKENVYLNGSILGLSESEIDSRLSDIVAFSELGEFIHAPVRTYSAGMRGRLGFSIAIHIDPDVLILDEVLTVGDAYFRDKAGSIVDRFQCQKKTVVIASHNMDLIRRVCTKAIWFDRGKIRMQGAPNDVTRSYVAECRRLREATPSSPTAQ